MFENFLMSLMRIFKFTARTDVFFYSMFYLIILLIVGTIEQKDIGLYAAQKKYFTSFFIKDFIVPFPSAYTVLGFMFLGLTVKTITTKFNKKNLGSFITHISVIILFIGGFITSVLSYEGFMVIEEGSSSSHFNDYRYTELAVIEKVNQTQKVTAFQHKTLKVNKSLSYNLPFKMNVLKFYNNAEIMRYNKPAEHKNSHISYNTYKVKKLLDNREPEYNQSAAILEINKVKYLVFEDMPFKPYVHLNDRHFKLDLRQKRTYLPFSVSLDDFNKDTYMDSENAKNYKSDIKIIDGESTWPALIEMNEPFRYKGYTFFQSSFIEGVKDSTVLAVVHNAGRLFPYIASIVFCLGLILHLIIRIPALIKKNIALFCMFLLLPAMAQAQNNFNPDISYFSKLPIIENGRIKPLSTFSRHYLLKFSNKENLTNLTAEKWLLELLLNPEQAYKKNVFKIKNPSLLNMLSLKRRDKGLYSFEEIVHATKPFLKDIQIIRLKEKSQRSFEENSLLRLYENSIDYYDISRSLSFKLPFFILNKEQSEFLNLEYNQSYDYLTMLPQKSNLQNLVKTSPNQENKKLLSLFHKIEEDAQTVLLKIIPEQWGNENVWFTPWMVFEAGQGSPKTADYFNLWGNLTLAYLVKDEILFKEISSQLYKKSFSLNTNMLKDSDKLKIELEFIYNKIKPFKVALIFSVIAFITCLFQMLLYKKWLTYFIFSLFLSTFLTQAAGLVMRMFIMSRPPVATLYESILFVSWIVIIFSFIFEWRRKDNIGYLIGSLLTTVLLFIASRYALDGDTMGNLVAVLNTNFWLSTHVVTITIAYGCCLVAAILGHLYLIKRLQGASASYLNTLNKNALAATLIALVFAVTGTILGGIWADQSWGRFWGWDPKENGAMLVCLWLILLLHGRISAVLNPLYFSGLLALTNIIIALAWFGVNLLGVGLHSYGFTENIAFNLFIFCVLQLSIVIGLLFFNLSQNKRKVFKNNV